MKGDAIVLDAHGAQIIFGIKPSRIRQWVRRGHLHPAGRDGRRNLYAEADIKRLLDKHAA